MNVIRGELLLTPEECHLIEDNLEGDINEILIEKKMTLLIDNKKHRFKLRIVDTVEHEIYVEMYMDGKNDADYICNYLSELFGVKEYKYGNTLILTKIGMFYDKSYHMLEYSYDSIMARYLNQLLEKNERAGYLEILYSDFNKLEELASASYCLIRQFGAQNYDLYKKKLNFIGYEPRDFYVSTILPLERVIEDKIKDAITLQELVQILITIIAYIINKGKNLLIQNNEYDNIMRLSDIVYNEFILKKNI